jgi:transposase
MIPQEVWMDVRLLSRQGASIRKIARLTGLSRTTVRKILAQKAPKPYGPRKPRPTKLEPFEPLASVALTTRPWVRATVLYDELRAQGYRGGYEAVKRWVRTRRREEQARRRACVRFETAPGVEGQCDFKGPVVGLLAADPSQPVSFFRFVLAFSRWQTTLAVPNQTLTILLASLRRAFEALDAVPQRLVIDNPKTAVLQPKPHLRLHPAFADFCRHYGCEPAPAWPYHPERKGKTERGLQDLTLAEILHRTYPSLEALQLALDGLDARQNQRLHGTTGQRPVDRLVAEQDQLLPLPAGAFDPRLPETRTVLSDCTVSFHGAFYSVPYLLVGSKVIVKADPWGRELEIFAGADRVAGHRLLAHQQRSIVEEHVAELRRPRFDRLRRRAAGPPAKPPAPEPTLVAWPRVEVPLRPIEEYLQALGGGA